MVEKYIGEKAARDIFRSAMMEGLKAGYSLEKSAQSRLDWLNFARNIIGDTAKTSRSVFGDVASAFSSIPSAIGIIAGLGAGTGALGAYAYDAMKNRVSAEDPEAKFNQDIEILYGQRRKELEDARWMSKVRTMRNELKRGYKKMSADEYRSKYNALVKALNERSK